MIDKIIFATGNEGKMKEVRMILKDLGLPVLSMKEAGVQADIVEDGTTFEENAKIKAVAVQKLTGALVLADDSGLEIDYLNKEPGIYSARYMGEDTPYSVKNANLISRLAGVPDEQRTARFVCAIAAAFPDGEVLTTRGTIEGIIGYEERGENGFGYDPIFYLPEYKKSYGRAFPGGEECAEPQRPRLSPDGRGVKKENPINGGWKRMKILIVSDTHKRLRNFDIALDRVGPVDMLLHLGDVEGNADYIEAAAGCPTYIVSGNNDFFSDLPKERELMIGKYKVFMTHGHYYYVSAGTETLKQEARARGAQIVLFGHTHRPVIDYTDDVIAVNPGSISYPRQEGHRPSFVMMELDRFGDAHFTINYL